MYQTTRQANDRVLELQVRVQAVWTKSTHQLLFTKKIWARIPPELQAVQKNLVHHLFIKLRAAVAELHTFVGDVTEDDMNTLGHKTFSTPISFSRIKFSLLYKHLKHVLDVLEQWQERFDPSWYTLILVADDQINQSLEEEEESAAGPSKDKVAGSADGSIAELKAIRDEIANSHRPFKAIRHPDFLAGERRPIKGAQCTTSSISHEAFSVIVDRTQYDHNIDMNSAFQQSCQLAKLLAHCDPAKLRLLTCTGLIKIMDSDGIFHQLELLYRIPPGLHSPISLRTWLRKKFVPLDDRLCVAQHLARSVMSVHTAGFVHKNIRPETILIFQRPESDAIEAFLVGFEQFRRSEFASTKAGDDAWERNLYRHPRRQGIRPQDTYVMQHDIYSLGVCLLELGLWRSFVAGGIGDERGDQALPAAEIEPHLQIKNPRERAKSIQQSLTKLAQEQLPASMGRRYAEVTLACLTCLDGPLTNVFGEPDDMKDENGILVGVAFIEKVLMKLADIEF